MKIAITAVTGQLGRAICDELAAQIGPENCIGLCRDPASVEIQGIELRPGDYNDRDGLKSSLAGADALLLVSGNDRPDKRIGQHRNVIAAAKAAGVQKLVYTSVQGAEEGTSFSSIIQSNRQTEADIRESGLDCVIGRNGIYIEPDIDYIGNYVKAGEIANCAGDGRCGYTTRPELAVAYTRMLLEPALNDQIFNLHGEPITQAELTAFINEAFDTHLVYRVMEVEAYRRERVAELGEFIGTIIAGIYAGIRSGASDNPSQFEQAAGRPHQSWTDYFAGLKAERVARI